MKYNNLVCVNENHVTIMSACTRLYHIWPRPQPWYAVSVHALKQSGWPALSHAIWCHAYTWIASFQTLSGGKRACSHMHCKIFTKTIGKFIQHVEQRVYWKTWRLQSRECCFVPLYHSKHCVHAKLMVCSLFMNLNRTDIRGWIHGSIQLPNILGVMEQAQTVCTIPSAILRKDLGTRLIRELFCWLYSVLCNTFLQLWLQ